MDPVKYNLEPIYESDLNFNKEEPIKKENNPENAPLSKVERESYQEISAVEKDDAYSKILSKIKTQTDDNASQSDIVSDAKTGMQIMDAETQIQHLIDLAQQKGVIHAVKVARHMENNYVLDTFHDRMLADELHDALVKRGMIKEI